MSGVTPPAFQRCVRASCFATFDLSEVVYACPKCGSLLDVVYDWSRATVPKSLHHFDDRRAALPNSVAGRADFSGVWRFRELLPVTEPDEIVTLGEGRTMLTQADELARELGMKSGRLFLQYEGLNPSGSFKDNGMTVAFTVARRLGRRLVACASTGNTSASLAMFARHASARDGRPMRAVVFVGGGKIAHGKLAQALDYGATTLQVRGDFDACMSLIQSAADRLGLYVMNSINPFRLEGQKSIMYRVLEGLKWEPPDWIVVPGGNLGNSSAFGKAYMELSQLGLVKRVPRLAVVNARGANTLFELVEGRGTRFNGGNDNPVINDFYRDFRAKGVRANTVATAIEIGQPVNLVKALRSLEFMKGVVRQATDEEILEGKALVGRFGFGCEPASGASIAGLRSLMEEGVIGKDDRVVCILTGHGLKDANVTVDYHMGASNNRRSYANPPVQVDGTMEAVAAALNTP